MKRVDTLFIGQMVGKFPSAVEKFAYWYHMQYGGPVRQYCSLKYWYQVGVFVEFQIHCDMTPEIDFGNYELRTDMEYIFKELTT